MTKFAQLAPDLVKHKTQNNSSQLIGPILILIFNLEHNIWKLQYHSKTQAGIWSSTIPQNHSDLCEEFSLTEVKDQ